MHIHKSIFSLQNFFIFFALAGGLVFSITSAFATYIPSGSSSSDTSFIKGQTCPSGFTQAGYDDSGIIKCNLLSSIADLSDAASAEVASSSWIETITNDAQSSAGTYFLVGGAPNFCTKKVISSAGEITISKINESLVCDSIDGKVCTDGKCLLKDNAGNLMCRSDDVESGTWKATNHMEKCGTENSVEQLCNQGECVGGELCSIKDGTGIIAPIDYKGQQWMGCTQVVCDGDLSRFHTGLYEDDFCGNFYEATSEENSSELSGFIYGEKAGYIKLKGASQDGTAYGVSMPENSVSGKLSGYAYGEKTGYIHFCNDSLYCAEYDSSTQKISGYVYAERAGYVKLSGISDSGEAYGVTFNPEKQRLEGTAYGEKSGFIRFSQENINPLSGGY